MAYQGKRLRAGWVERDRPPRKRGAFGEVQWGVEIVKAILTSFVFLLISTGLFWIIMRHSPGEYTGRRLDEYLLRQIARDAGIAYRQDGMVTEKRLDAAKAPEAGDRIVLCGGYSSENNGVWDGRFLYVFERAEETFWNNFTGVRPPYVPAFSLVSQEVFYDSYTLWCGGCRYEDINGDDTPEILVQYQSNFADRVSNTVVVLQSIGGEWRYVSPDLSGVYEEALALAGDGGAVLLDTFSFFDPRDPAGQEILVYGQSHHGALLKVDNPFWGGYDWLYCIAVNDGTTGMIYTDKSVFVMERLTEHGIFQDPNWNNGEILYMPAKDFDEREDVESRWGLRTESASFYGPDA